MTQDQFTYRVTWYPEDREHVGLCAEFPSLPWLAATPEGALASIRRVVAEALCDMEAKGETLPDWLRERHAVRIAVQYQPTPSPRQRAF